jgi:hypothetical protein
VLEFAIATIGRGVLHGRLVYTLGLQGRAEKEITEKSRSPAKKTQYGHAIATRSNEYEGDLVSINRDIDGAYDYVSLTRDVQPRNGTISCSFHWT